MTPTAKTCTRCGEVLPLTDYHRAPKGLYGHAAQCKACRSAQRKAYRERVAAERIEPAPTDTKTCTKCGETKLVTEYHRDSANSDGLSYQCRNCAIAEVRRWREANRDRVLATHRAYYEATRERRTAYRAEKWATDPEYRDRMKAYKTRYYRLKANAKQEPYTREEIFERDGWVCGICDQPIDPGLLGQVHPDAPSIDHIVPLNRGGDDTPANVQAAHFGCNAGKCDRVEHEDAEVAA